MENMQERKRFLIANVNIRFVSNCSFDYPILKKLFILYYFIKINVSRYAVLIDN